jgi:competence protein ComEA
MRSRRMHLVWALILCLGISLAAMPSIAMAQKDAGQPSAMEKVNLNTATVEQLQTIPGIGPAMAKRVVEYRTKVGKFVKIEDILNVKGIGEKMFQKMKDRLTV